MSTSLNQTASPALERAEYIEQEHLFRLLGERIVQQMPIQELLEQVHYELSASTRLPMAVSFLLTELKHSGVMATAMARMPHYFAAFQTYLIAEAERDTGKFDMRVALKILQAEARYRADSPSREGLFFYQFEALCRNRLRYDAGLKAIAADPVYDAVWVEFILRLRMQIGFIDFADYVFLHSDEYRQRLIDARESLEGKGPFIFGRHEGRIAFSTRQRDPLFLFSALQRHLGYPAVPRPVPPDRTLELVPQLSRRVERLEARIQLLEQENRTGIDITRFYGKKTRPVDLPEDLDE
ncbi:MAG: hypothetical protein ACO1RT_11795 [Planctomycetaceae bacterium]